MTGVESGDAVARRWAAESFSFGVWEDPPGAVSADKVHEADELIYVVSGRMLFEMDSLKTELAAGEETMIPAGTRHTVKNVGTTKARWYYGYKRAS